MNLYPWFTICCPGPRLNLVHDLTVRFSNPRPHLIPLHMMIPFSKDSYAPRTRIRISFIKIQFSGWPGDSYSGIQCRHSMTCCCFCKNLAIWMFEEKKKKKKEYFWYSTSSLVRLPPEYCIWTYHLNFKKDSQICSKP